MFFYKGVFADVSTTSISKNFFAEYNLSLHYHLDNTFEKRIK